MTFNEVTASSLVKIDIDGNVIDPGNASGIVNVAGYVIHSAVHAARHDITCIVHNHHTACVAVASSRCGILPVSQEACIVWGRLADKTHPFEGVATDPEERSRIVANLGDSAQVLMMQNHGVLCCGTTLHEAFWNTFLITRACELQVL